MASSDEEGEIIPDCVSNYHFVDSDEVPVPFSILPVKWCEDETPDNLNRKIFLCGTSDDGLQQIYKRVVAWKFELCFAHPEIYVLSKDKTWIQLQRPRKSFQGIIKSILVTIYCLHFVKKNPEASTDAVWNNLLKVFSSYDVEPSESDLEEHKPLISESAMRNEDIAKSQYLATFLSDMPEKRKALHEEDRVTKKAKFIVEEDDDENGSDDYEHDEENDVLFDSVCALCDNGGEVLPCEGRCTRSFHATVEAGADSFCESLGYTDAQVNAIQAFVCKNCQYQLHQCFACGVLGSSNRSSGAEVFLCVSATCGRFFHPKCVAELLHPWDKFEAEELQKNIFAGESFTCPAHTCFLCHQVEDKKAYDLQFAVCRRCPKAYHRKCLPSEIIYASDNSENIHQRAWDGLLPNRILIYCMDHKIIPEIGTPARNHIVFPDSDGSKTSHENGNLKMKIARPEEKRMGKIHTPVKGGDSPQTNKKELSRLGFKAKNDGVVQKSLKDNSVSASANVYNYKHSNVENGKPSLRSYQFSRLRVGTSSVKSKQQSISYKTGNTYAVKHVQKNISSANPSVDAGLEKRMMELINKSTSSFNMEEFFKNHKWPSTHAYGSKSAIDKSITQGKVEASVKAIRTALKKLQEGCTIEEAKAVCEPDIINQIFKWKRKLSIYLGPFLHGMRYTSFGRHFTKVEKLEEIIERLHWYVRDGDMIVDFCCGSNDFSCLMKAKLDKMGKKCLFKNYDFIQPKNDFNFEKRDWMSIRVEELPLGSRLIMGLNPPFGVRASLANQFISKALQFRPKLLILIVPKETKRLEKMKPPYDLIWEDDHMLSGKSFYLPGSTDAHNQQVEQWNLDPPLLYLWSHPEWTAQHRAIAQEHGHIMVEEKYYKLEMPNFPMEENNDWYADFSNMVDGYGDLSHILDDVPEESDDTVKEVTGATIPKNHNYDQSDSGGSREGYCDSSSVLPLQNDNLDEMCMDMELSTAYNSPKHLPYCSDSALYEHFETHPYISAQGASFPDIQAANLYSAVPHAREKLQAGVSRAWKCEMINREY